jgi:hypothetical protein
MTMGAFSTWPTRILAFGDLLTYEVCRGIDDKDWKATSITTAEDVEQIAFDFGEDDE